MPPLVAYFFQDYLFKYHHGKLTLINIDWWKKYNYILAVAVDSGVGIAVLIIGVLNSYGFRSRIGPFNPDMDKAVPLE
jgi:hypothetical protein